MLKSTNIANKVQNHLSKVFNLVKEKEDGQCYTGVPVTKAGHSFVFWFRLVLLSTYYLPGHALGAFRGGILVPMTILGGRTCNPCPHFFFLWALWSLAKGCKYPSSGVYKWWRWEWHTGPLVPNQHPPPSRHTLSKISWPFLIVIRRNLRAAHRKTAALEEK